MRRLNTLWLGTQPLYFKCSYFVRIINPQFKCCRAFSITFWPFPTANLQLLPEMTTFREYALSDKKHRKWTVAIFVDTFISRTYVIYTKCRYGRYIELFTFETTPVKLIFWQNKRENKTCPCLFFRLKFTLIIGKFEMVGNSGDREL
jgi:hypothetical protein